VRAETASESTPRALSSPDPGTLDYPRPARGHPRPQVAVYHRRFVCIVRTFCANVPCASMRGVERQYRPENRVGNRPMKEQHCHPEGTRPGRGDLPRWPAAVALLSVGALYAVISGALTFGPRAFLLTLVSVRLVPLLSAHQQGRHRLARLARSQPGRSRQGRLSRQRVSVDLLVV
jgi:hypothetical protein